MLTDAHTHFLKTGLTTVYQINALSTEPAEGFYSAGIHPKDSASWKEQVEELEAKLSQDRCVAVGECGLDNRYAIPMELQEEAYVAQLKLAVKYDKPVILHSVNSWDRCRFLHAGYSPQQVLIYHGFSKASIVDQILNYAPAIISVGQRLQVSLPLQEAVATIPIERLLLETDDVEMDISELYRLLSELKSLSLPALTATLHGNFKRIFDVELA